MLMYQENFILTNFSVNLIFISIFLNSLSQKHLDLQRKAAYNLLNEYRISGDGELWHKNLHDFFTICLLSLSPANWAKPQRLPIIHFNLSISFKYSSRRYCLWSILLVRPGDYSKSYPFLTHLNPQLYEQIVEINHNQKWLKFLAMFNKYHFQNKQDKMHFWTDSNNWYVLHWNSNFVPKRISIFFISYLRKRNNGVWATFRKDIQKNMSKKHIRLQAQNVLPSRSLTRVLLSSILESTAFYVQRWSKSIGNIHFQPKYY